MTRILVCLLVVLASLPSCGRPAYLVTDAPFRQAFPEVISAWRSLAPWHDARLWELPEGTPIEASLAQTPRGSALIIGAALTDADRANLAAAHPGVRFFGPPQSSSPSVGINQDEASRIVVEAVAAPGRTAWILLPANADPTGDSALVQAWLSRGGAAAQVVHWPTSSLPPPGADVFDFAGPEADSLMAPLAETRRIHGNPGVPRGAAGPGTEWKLAPSRLAESLWNAAQNSSQNREFLPLETPPASR